MTTLTYTYGQPSELIRGDASLLGLSSFTPAEQLTQAPPLFFDGFAVRPDIVASGINAVATIAARRFYEPFHLVAKRIAAADPVVTYDGSSLRFESFSICGSVHARLDVDADGLEVEQANPGTTNVDANPPLAAALGQVLPGDPMGLRIGTDHLTVDLVAGSIVEKQVPLPKRWVRGFGETQVQQRALEARIDIAGPAAQRFFSGFPTSARGVFHLEQTPTGVRRTSRMGRATVAVSGPERLAGLAALARSADRVVVYAAPSDAGLPSTTSWEISMPTARLTFTVSAKSSQGFSGDGGLLSALSDEEIDRTDDALTSMSHRAVSSTADLAVSLGNSAAADRALDVLAAAGRVGYDLHASGSYVRHLPFGAAVEDLNPRLQASRTLLESDAVEFTDDALTRAQVHSGDHHHVVVLRSDETSVPTCTCPWFAKHRGTRGPCKHVMATVAMHRKLVQE